MRTGGVPVSLQATLTLPHLVATHTMTYIPGLDEDSIDSQRSDSSCGEEQANFFRI